MAKGFDKTVTLREDVARRLTAMAEMVSSHGDKLLPPEARAYVQKVRAGGRAKSPRGMLADAAVLAMLESVEASLPEEARAELASLVEALTPKPEETTKPNE